MCNNNDMHVQVARNIGEKFCFSRSINYKLIKINYN